MRNLFCIIALALLCTTCRLPSTQEQPDPKLVTCADIATGGTRPTQLLFQRADHSLWLAPLDQKLNPSLIDVCRRQLTESLRPDDDVVKWSLSPDQQWLAYVQVRGWRKTNEDRGKARLLNLWTGEKRTLLDNLWAEDYNWMAEPWDVDRAVIESDPLWSQDSTRFTLVSAHAGRVGLYLYTLTTGKLTLLAQGQKNIAWPQWSPDESYLLYHDIIGFGTGAGPTGGALWAVRTDGSEPPHRLSQTDEHFERVSGWVDNTHISTYKSEFVRPVWDVSTVNIQTGSRISALTDELRGHPCWHYSNESNELTVKLQPLITDWLDCNVVLSPTGRFAAAISNSTVEHDSRFVLINLSDGAVTTLVEAPNPSVAAFNPTWSPTGDLLLWWAPTSHLATNENSKYSLWATWVEQKQPFLVAEQVDLWSKLQWITDDKR